MEDTIEDLESLPKRGIRLRSRWKVISLVSIVVLLLLGYIAYSALGAYLMRTDPIPLENHVVIDVQGNIGQATCMNWLDERHLIVCDAGEGSVIVYTCLLYTSDAADE